MDLPIPPVCHELLQLMAVKTVLFKAVTRAELPVGETTMKGVRMRPTGLAKGGTITEDTDSGRSKDNNSGRAGASGG